MDLIIVNYKSTDFLRVCLNSVHNAMNGLPVKAFVVDNGSRDHVQSVKLDFPWTHLIENYHNLGFSKAVNQVLKKTDSKYTVFLNPDAVVKNGFFEAVESFMGANPDVGILGPKILDSNGCIQGSARTFPNFRSALAGRTSLISRMFPKNRMTCAHILSNNSDGKTPMQVDWVSGACMVARRETLDKVGFFDERFFLYWEDVDLCKRVLDGGWKVVYYPSATVVHAVGGSSECDLVRSVFEFHKSAYLYFMKHHKKFRFILRPFILLGLSFRFSTVLGMQFVRRMLSGFRKKSNSLIKAFSDLPN
jgi:GT2 family glycosyltransferase